MAGSALLVGHRIGNAVELGFIVAATLYIVPRLKAVYPEAPDLLWEAGVPLIVALLVAVVSLLWWQRPVIIAEWREDSGPVLDDLRTELVGAERVSPPYQVTFGGVPKGLLTQALVWWLRTRRDLRVVTFVPSAPISTTVRHSSPDRDGRPLGAPDYDNGFSMRVGHPPQPDTWLWASVFFQAATAINQVPFTVRHAMTAQGSIANALAKFVVVRSRTKRVTFY
ncbi:hypothetical protein [Microbacterium sp. TPU 3598]|uniref:hypothetical protein n=1 Tax=Microbacterium sp. TPU 3598 TaxID=1938334 RepID=UPI0012FD3249|nr:hypothetical protein [Microbacterium sp. TPU 3598]